VTPPATCATVSIGYADGYLRSLTGSGSVYIKGEKCPVIGRVSMDSVIIDVAHLTATPAIGDAVEILGPHQPVDDLAAAAGTIGYEILTGLGLRTPRTYIGGTP
jgi:alanine racemase